MSSVYFEEKQRSAEIAICIIIVALVQLLFLWGLIQQVFFGEPWGMNPAGDMVLILINVFNILLILFFRSIQLKITITDKNISIRMSPFHIREKIFEWNEIHSIRVVKCDFIKEYLGYGIRNRRGKGWAFTISGDYGIRLVMTNGKKMIIGTHKAKEVSQVINDMKNKGIISNVSE